MLKEKQQLKLARRLVAPRERTHARTRARAQGSLTHLVAQNHRGSAAAKQGVLQKETPLISVVKVRRYRLRRYN